MYAIESQQLTYSQKYPNWILSFLYQFIASSIHVLYILKEKLYFRYISLIEIKNRMTQLFRNRLIDIEVWIQKKEFENCLSQFDWYLIELSTRRSILRRFQFAQWQSSHPCLSFIVFDFISAFWILTNSILLKTRHLRSFNIFVVPDFSEFSIYQLKLIEHKWNSLVNCICIRMMISIISPIHF